MTTTDTNELALHLEAGHQLLPLHAWGDRDEDGRERGKSPMHRNWTRKPYRNDEQIRHMERGRNVGVRLTAAQVVVDVDPRNFEPVWEGVDPFAELVLRLGLDPDEWPRVETGSGGSHYYLTKPEGVSVRDSLPDFPGVEFKSLGRQVVAAGSVHPCGRRYEWDFLSPSPADAPAAPDALLEAIARPTSTAVGVGGGEHTVEEVERMLDALEPEDFRDHDAWLTLMQACHHASGGDARQEFVEWSTCDPAFSDHGGLIGRRWDSLDAAPGGPAVTFRTLHKLLRDAGREDAIPRTSAEEDFDGVEDAEVGGGPGGDPASGLVDEMNRRFCAVLDGGGFSVFMRDQDPAFGRPFWARLSREAFRNFFEDERVPVVGSSRERQQTKADLWLAHPGRRKYRGVVMDPQGLPESRGKLNLWQGWAVEPRPGDWSLMRELIEDVLCDGSSASADYVLRWIAFMLQRPWQPPEAAIAFRGEEGTGKGTLGRALMRIAGTHGLTVTSASQLAGRFNAHLRDSVFLFADEAVWPGDKAAEGTLKALVTEPVVAYEAKGKDAVMGRNMVHLMLASNEEWVVPAGRSARRFFVSDVSTRRCQDEAFFERLNRQTYREGGLEAMAHDLLAMDLGGWRPSRDIPRTQALADQKVLSLGPVEKFWHELLGSGELPGLSDADGTWRASPVTLGNEGRNELVDALDLFLKRNRIFHVKATHRALLSAGKRLGVEVARAGGGSERLWTLPPLGAMRSAFEEVVGAQEMFD